MLKPLHGPKAPQPRPEQENTLNDINWLLEHKLLRDSDWQHAIFEATGTQAEGWLVGSIWFGNFTLFPLPGKAGKVKTWRDGLLKKMSAKLGAMMHRIPWSFSAQGLTQQTQRSIVQTRCNPFQGHNFPIIESHYTNPDQGSHACSLDDPQP